MKRSIWIALLFMLCACAQAHESPLWARLRQLAVSAAALAETLPPADEAPPADDAVTITHDDVMAFLAAHPELATVDMGYLAWLETEYDPSVALEWLNDQLTSREPRPPMPPPIPTPENQAP